MLTALTLAALLGSAHPIHSSSASLDLAPGERTATIVLRVYADDFPPGSVPEAIERYLAERLQVNDRAGRPISLHLAAVRTEGLVLIVRLTLATPDGLHGLSVWYGVLGERFRDQINILQAHYDGRSASLLFTASDGPKPLP